MEAKGLTTGQARLAAENYEKIVARYTSGPFAEILLEYARPQPGEKVLDIACGTGIVARLVTPRVGAAGAVVGVDANLAMLAVARSLPTPPGTAIEWCGGNAQALPLPAGFFDLVLCQNGLQFFPDRPAALREMQRVLRAGGRAVLSVWRSAEYNPVWMIIWEALARRLSTPIAVLAPQFSLGDAGELRELIVQAGFIVETIAARSYTVRQPRDPRLIAQILDSVKGIVPPLAALAADDLAALAQAVELEAGPALHDYEEGGEQLFPRSTHIAVARKPID